MQKITHTLTTVGKDLKDFVKDHPLPVVILLVAAILRLWRLPELGIFFGDAGRDFLAAWQMIETGQIPLKGIPTSVPIFHQGPLMIWLIGMVAFLSSWNVTIIFSFFAFLGVMAVGLVYWLVDKELDHPIASSLATLILATSPLAVAHSRMAYHITPIPLFTVIYLITILGILRQKKWAVFWAALSWGVLFQLELSLLPLVVVIPWAMWRSKQLHKQQLLFIIIGGMIGVLPFIVQLRTVINRIFEKLLSGEGAETFQKTINLFPLTIENFWHYFTRFVSIDYLPFTVVMGILLVTTIAWIVIKRKTLPLLIQATLSSFLFLTLGYVIRGQPSEAYMPPYFIYTPILLGWGVMVLYTYHQLLGNIAIGFVSVFALINSWAIVQNNFFVTPSPSSFHYGISYGEQIQVMKEVLQYSESSGYLLDSTAPEQRFASYLDNFRFAGKILGEREVSHESEVVQKFFIEPKNSTLVNYPGAIIYPFPSVNLVVIPELQFSVDQE